jgi:hypothetical protein
VSTPVAKRDDIQPADRDEIAPLIERIDRGDLAEADRHQLSYQLRLLLTHSPVVEQKNLSIKRPKRLLFGPGTGKRTAPPGD